MDFTRFVNKESHKSVHKESLESAKSAAVTFHHTNTAHALRWVSSYDGKKVSFIAGQIMCIKYTDYVKFSGDKVENYFSNHNKGIQTVATHPTLHVFAYSENIPNPTIFIAHYPENHIINKIEDKELLEYQMIEFSNSSFMATISGIPKFELNIWQWNDLTKVYSVKLPHHKASLASFNPKNQNLFAICYPDYLYAWNIDLSPKARTEQRIFKAPTLTEYVLEEWQELQDLMSLSTNDFMKTYLNLPPSTMTDLSPAEFEEFVETMKSANRTTFGTFTWTQDSELIVACTEEELIKFEMDSPNFVVMNKQSKPFSAKSTHMVALSRYPVNDTNPSTVYPKFTGTFDSERSRFIDLRGNELESLGKLTCILQTRKFLIAGSSCGNISYLELERPDLLVELKRYSLKETILSFSLSATHLYVGTVEGSLYQVNQNRQDKVPVKRFHYDTSPIISLGVFYTVKTIFVTLKESGLLETWNAQGEHTSSLSLDPSIEVTSMAVSRLFNVAAVGTKAGLIYLAVIEKNSNPRWLYPKKVHYKPITSIQSFPESPFFVAVYQDAKVFIMSGLPSHNFNPLVYIDLKDDGFSNIGHAAVSESENSLFVGLEARSSSGQSVLVCFSFNGATLSKRPEYLVNKDNRFKDHKIRKSVRRIEEQVVSMALFSQGLIAVMTNNKGIKVFSFAAKLNDEMELVEEVISTRTYPEAILRSNSLQSLTERESYSMQTEGPIFQSKEYVVMDIHLTLGPFPMGGTGLSCAFIKEWMVSSWKSGIIRIHNVQNGNLLWSYKCLSFWNGGVTLTCLSIDCRCIAFTGDGMFCCSDLHPVKGLKRKDFHQAHQTATQREAEMRREQRNEHMHLESLRTMTNTHISETLSGQNKTNEDEKVIIRAIEKAIEQNSIYNPSVDASSSMASWMETTNAKQMNDDEKSYGQTRFQLRSKVWKLRQKLMQLMEENNQESELERIPFQEFNLDVQQQKNFKKNFDAEIAMMKRNKEVENKEKRRLVEMIKTLCWDDMAVKGKEIGAFNEDYSVSNYPLKERSEEELTELRRVLARRKVEIADQAMRNQMGDKLLPSKKSKQSSKSEEEVEKEEISTDQRTNRSLYGSLGFQLGGENDLFYSQLELCTKWQKINQVSMLKDSIYRIQVEFNTKFNEMMDKKVMEIKAIQKRNQRIVTIMKDLGISTEEIVEPCLSSLEQPELLFTTDDEEVKSMKFADRGMMQDELGQVEEEDVGRDNWRERGLEKMMGGLLEIKKEDELKKEIPVPAFMLEKAEDKWSEEEKKAAADYKMQLKTQEEEREKYKKVLEVELRKLQVANMEGMQRFDASLFEFFHYKINVQSSIYQEELKILRLRLSMLYEEGLNKKEAYLKTQLETLKEEMNQITVILTQVKGKCEAYQAFYDSHADIDRTHDKMFRKKFPDLPQPITDLLYKLYKKRPKKKNKKLDGKEEPIESTDIDPMQDLDHAKNIPEGVNPNQWMQFCAYRREKVAKEAFLKEKVVMLLELQKETSAEQKRLDAAKQNLDETYNAINQLSVYRYQFYRNLELQLLMKQGQVEVDQSTSLYNFRNCLLIHREVVEELNKNIKIIGENKIATMIDSKDFKKGIAQLEWEHRKMEMELQDLKSKMKDIDNFKVTKEVLYFLKKDNYDEMKNQEILTLEKTINMAKIYHEKNMKMKRSKVDELVRTTKALQNKNDKLTAELKKLNQSILVRKKIHDVVVDKSGMAKIEMAKRHKMMVEKGRLMHVSKEQAEEIASLKEQIEQLQRKTFPSLELDRQASMQLSCVRKKNTFLERP